MLPQKQKANQSNITGSRGYVGVCVHRSVAKDLLPFWFSILVLLFSLTFLMQSSVQAQNVRPPDNAVNQKIKESEGVSNTLGNNSQSDYWRALRHGKKGQATTHDKGTVLIQSQGEDWRLIRRGYIIKYASWILIGVLLVLALFFLIRGRIRLKGGRSGKTISRFTLAQRTSHWFMASVFIILAVSGLIILLGRVAIAPWLGKAANSVITSAAMQGHNLFGPLFIVALIWLYYMLLPGNFLRKVDFKWILKGGGLLGGHASAGHYNFGEKVWFWFVAFIGLIMSVTGIILEFPWMSANLQLLQVSTIAHAIGAIGLIAFAFGHIYIGTIGMEGALESMTTGDVDVNWAKEHHDLWYEEVTGQKADAETASGHATVYTQEKATES